MDYDIEKIKDIVSSMAILFEDLVAELGLDIPTIDVDEPEEPEKK